MTIDQLSISNLLKSMYIYQHRRVFMAYFCIFKIYINLVFLSMHVKFSFKKYIFNMHKRPVFMMYFHIFCNLLCSDKSFLGPSLPSSYEFWQPGSFLSQVLLNCVKYCSLSYQAKRKKCSVSKPSGFFKSEEGCVIFPGVFFF